MKDLTVTLKGDVKRIPAGRGVCAWCGRVTNRYVYRYPGQLNYRLGVQPNEAAFCTQSCDRSYWG
jgi:hypothetical protein